MLIYVTIIVNDKEAMNLIGVRENAEGVGGGGGEGRMYIWYSYRKFSKNKCENKKKYTYLTQSGFSVKTWCSPHGQFLSVAFS